MKDKRFYYLLILIYSVFQLAAWSAMAQNESVYEEPTTGLWINNYGKFRLTDKLFWIAQFHYRRAESENIALVGNMAQIYNRHAINYMFSKQFNASFGGVLRLDYNQNRNPEVLDQNKMVAEYRIWHEYLFALPLGRVMVYHRLRLEHRWSRGFGFEDDYIFRNRYRYLFNVKIPINSKSLSPGSFYLSPEAEIIMQSGKQVVDSPLEELRLIGGVGYIFNPRITCSVNGMYGLGQRLNNGAIYRQRFVLRLHLYISLDFRKVNNRLPTIRQLE